MELVLGARYDDIDVDGDIVPLGPAGFTVPIWPFSSSSCMTWGGSEAEEERTKRRRPPAITSRLRWARARIIWCMVGTAVYHVGSASFIQPKNFMALKPGVQYTQAAAVAR